MFERRQNLVAEKFRQYLLPTILMTMSTSMALVVDGIIVGNLLGAKELAALNLTMPLILCFSALFAMVGVGGSTLMAMARAGRDEKQVAVIISLSTALLAGGGVLFSILGSIFLPEITKALSSQAELQALVSDYAWVLLFGAPVQILVSGLTFFIRSDGAPRFASKVLIVANVVNLSMDVVYIRFLGMGIEGAGLATVSGYSVGAVMIGIYLLRPGHGLSFILPRKAICRRTGEILATGATSALGQIFLFVKILALNHIVLMTLGTAGMVAFSVCISCLSLVSMFISGATQTMMPIVGAMYGEKDWQGIRFTLHKALSFVVWSSLLLILVFELIPQWVMACYGVHDPDKVAVGVHALRLFAPSLLGVGFSFVVMYYFQAVRQRRLSIATSVVQGLFVVPCAYLLSKVWGGTGIWLSFIVSELVTVAFIAYMARAKRVKNPGLYSSVFLFPKPEEARFMDVTLFSSSRDAAQISEQVADFAGGQGLESQKAMMVGLAAEEMAMLITRHSYDGQPNRPIDVMVHLDPKDVILRFRDGGKAFNPTTCPEDENEACSNIFLLRKLAQKIDYTRVIGLNSTIVTMARA
ncbi:MAG: MATE family efflux transporter [Thermodesulfobacteriota bacterium]